jgi:hypothetical protein
MQLINPVNQIARGFVVFAVRIVISARHWRTPGAIRKSQR